jgi:hypothetical protein
VLRLEQERGKGGGASSAARELEELRKLIVDIARRKDAEISHLKTQVRREPTA